MIEIIEISLNTVDGKVHNFKKGESNVKSIQMNSKDGKLKVTFDKNSQWNNEIIYIKHVVSLKVAYKPLLNGNRDLQAVSSDQKDISDIQSTDDSKNKKYIHI